MKIIYIASDVRSGSTLLDYLLGNHPDAVGVGEIRYLYTHIIREGKGDKHGWNCSCGDPVEACSFWSPVLEEVKQHGVSPREDDTGYVLEQGRKWKNLLTLAGLLVPIRGYQKRIVRHTQIDEGSLTHLKNCFSYMSAIHKIHDKVIVDSSKKGKQLVNLLAALESRSDVEIKVIHLIRDPRATTWSKVKRQGLPHTPWRFLRSMVSWVTENAEIRLVRSLLEEEDWMTVRYEDLCEDLDGVLDQIWHRVGLSRDAPGLGELNKEAKHNICGSPTRFEKDRTEVKLERKWLDELRASHRLIYRLVAWPLLAAVGYGRRNYYK